MALKAWHTVVSPREDLRDGKPLDASEFAVHLDQVRDGRAPKVYQNPEQFFDRTYLTQNLTSLAAEVIRRLSGERTETSAVFNMTTQFGGGKTHALTLLYHLATNGPKANEWRGVRKLLERAGMKTVPQAETAVFVGTEFDSIAGRGGEDGTPLRKTPWGEIAYQLGGAAAFAVVAEHDQQGTAPAGDVIRKFLPADKPCLILMDELLNYISRNRKSGLGAQLYNFLQSLSEEARGRDNVALAVSIPASELEMSAEDMSDYERFKKLLDRLGKAVIMSAESETSEIIRRRLFEWDQQAVSADGRVMLDKEAIKTCQQFAEWVIDRREQLPSWFPIDNARAAFEATYPFHPMVLSVFERKWQALPRFQQTRGILRLLALWVSRAYREGYEGAHRDPLLGLGTAPLDDPMFRAAMFEQLGESKLEAAVTTDIIGKPDSFATRFDKDAVDAIKKARLHRKVATAIFFESNGGQYRAEATEPEIRLAVAEPAIDIGNVETVLETLTSSCYYLLAGHKRYRFSFTPNLNKLLSDRRASIQTAKIRDRALEEVRKVFSKKGSGIDPVYFPERSNQITDRPVLTLAVLPPDQSFEEKAKTMALIETMTRESGASARTFKSAIIWAVPDGASGLNEDARKLLAWEDIDSEVASGTLKLDDGQKKQLAESLKKAERDLYENVWRTYKNIVLLGKDNQPREIDLGLIHSSAADSIVALILNRLLQSEDIAPKITPTFLVRNWPPAFKEWSTKSVRDAFYASPQFPRLINADVVKETIARGVEGGFLAYVAKGANGEYKPFTFANSLNASEVEISDDVFIISKETATAYLQAVAAKTATSNETNSPDTVTTVVSQPGETQTTGVGVNIPPVSAPEPSTKPALATTASRMTWTGEIPAQKWTNFYTKILTKYSSGKGLKITLQLEVSPENGISPQKIEETKMALRELGLSDDVKAE
jgi:hypothetical protein